MPQVGPALQDASDLALELVVDIGQSGEVAFLKNCGAEARFAEDHDAGRGLEQVSAGPGSHDEEEGILHAPMQPDDSGQPAEHLPLPPLPQDGRVFAGI